MCFTNINLTVNLFTLTNTAYTFYCYLHNAIHYFAIFQSVRYSFIDLMEHRRITCRTLYLCCINPYRYCIWIWFPFGRDIIFDYIKLLEVKVTSFGRVAFSYSAVQPPFDINFPWSLGYMGKLACWSAWGNYFIPGFVCSQHTAPRNIQLAQTLPGYQFKPWSSGASEIHILCPEKFTLDQCRIRITDPSIIRRTWYHWTNAPHYMSLNLKKIRTCEIDLTIYYQTY